MANKLEKKLMDIEEKIKEKSVCPPGVEDKLEWHLNKIEELIGEGGGGDIQLKTINGQELKGEGNISITTYQAFPEAWESKTSSLYTTKQFCDTVNADESAVIGMGYFGGAKWSDKPAGLANGDVVVEILEGPSHTKAIHLIMTSSTVYPYRWEYTYWSNGQGTSPWRGVQPALSKHLFSIGNISIELILPFPFQITGQSSKLTFAAVGKISSSEEHNKQLGYLVWNVDEFEIWPMTGGAEIAAAQPSGCNDVVSSL